jgi:hypothetical protein
MVFTLIAFFELATGASEVEAFVQANEDLDAALVQQRLGTRLPAYIYIYMVPAPTTYPVAPAIEF